MIIICPHCGFRRDVPDDRIPPNATRATCPHCKHRFDFIDVPGQTASPLPQGARIPHMGNAASTDSSQQDHNANTHTESVQGTSSSSSPQAEAFGHTKQGQGQTNTQAQMEQAADLFDEDELGTPWDMAPERLRGIEAFYQTCLQVMFATSYFFGRLNPLAPQSKALTFYIVVSVLQVLLERFWGQALGSFLLSSGTDDPQLLHLADLLAPADNLMLTLLVRSALLTLQLYIMSGLFYLALRVVAPNKQSFSLVFQVVAYAAAPELLSVVPLLGSVVGMIWSVVCTVVGLRHALQLNWFQAFSTVLPLYMLLIPILLQIVAGMAAL